MDKSQFRTLLKKYKDGHANPQERAIVDVWYEQLKSDAKPLTKAEQSLLRDAIQRGIDRQIRLSSKNRKHFSNYYIRFAAALLIFTGIGLLIWKNRSGQAPDKPIVEYVEVYATAGKLKHITLPDSSLVWLNAGSKLRFAMPFGADSTRRVVLEYGEAFFDIAPDARKPFIVHSDDLDTRVLGTSFTIRAYASLPDIEVSVLSGHVEVSRPDYRMRESLKKGDQLVYNKQHSSHTIQQVETRFSNAWTEGITYLSQASFAELALIFKNAYNMQLKAGHERILDQKYSIQLDRKTPINDIIKAICALYQNKYRKEGNTITIY